LPHFILLFVAARTTVQKWHALHSVFWEKQPASRFEAHLPLAVDAAQFAPPLRRAAIAEIMAA